MRVASWLLCAVASAACGGDDPPTIPPPVDARPLDGPRSDGASEACADGEVHVFPCCGGALPACVAVLDGGVCPPGTEEGQCWNPGVGPSVGCADVCEPPPSYCAPAGSDCRDECNGGGTVDGDGDCLCVCA